MKRSHLFCCALTAATLTGCVPLASVRTISPTYPGPGNRLNASVTFEKTDPRKALGDDLGVAAEAYRDVMRNPGDSGAMRRYNYAVARVVETINEDQLEPWKSPISVDTPAGALSLTCPIGKDPERNPARYRLLVCDRMEIGGQYFEKRHAVDGFGAPLVAIGREAKSAAEAKTSLRRTYGTVTAYLHFEGRQASLRFAEPLASETVLEGGHKFTLAADYTAALALVMAEEKPDRLGLARLLHPEKYADTARLTRLQAYDPKRIPVIFVHGLQDTPACWSEMINDMRGDADLRRRYQFWVYSYPSGYPYPYSAALFRNSLDAVKREFPHSKPIVLVGHSMGSLVSRLMITDSGDKLWRMYFGKSPAETKIGGASRADLEKTLIFQHRPEVHRVVFMSAPHRGSNLASIWFGRLASSLVHPPELARRIQRDALPLLTADHSAMKMSRMPNSIDTLSPTNRFVVEINKIPLTPGIPYHSIMGDRGRGDTPNSSDGVVPYWSSHLDGAQSEKIVPSGHGSPLNPQGIAEVERILHENRE